MPAKDCPNCGLANPPEAGRCDCGYDFVNGQGPPGGGDRRDGCSRLVGAGCLVIGGLIVAWLVNVFTPDGEERAGIGLILSLCFTLPCAALFLAVGFYLVWRRR